MSAAPPLILNVDDYVPARYARTRALLDAGYRVGEAGTGGEALALVRTEPPALVILDVNLPDMSGFEVCRTIKENPSTTHVLVLHVSATSVGMQSRLSGLTNGADSYLTEPVEQDELLAHVAALLRLRSAEERARQAHATVAAVVDAAPLPMVALDRHGRVQMWNPAAARVFGHEAGDVMGARWPPGAEAGTAALLDRIATAGSAGFTGFETVAQRHDGTEFQASVSAAPLQGNGFHGGVLLMFEDITARKRVEAETSRLLAEARLANRAKDEFLAVLSHELRTPLNAVLGWIRMLRRGEVGAERIAHAMAVIERNALAQARLIEDILDVSRIVSGKLKLSAAPVDLLQVARTALEAAQPQVDARRLVLASEMGERPLFVVGDHSRLQQIVANLLANAIKFTPEGGWIRLAVRGDDDTARIVVQDSGVGIEAAFLPFVFDRFRQANSSLTRQHEGLGLGLAIVRHLAEAHGGNVAAESGGPGSGSTFTVTLPLVDEAMEPAERADRAAGTLHGVRILVVDDHEDSRDMVAALLEAHGAAVATAGSAVEATVHLEDSRPDVIVADLGMPREDGYSLLQRVRHWFDPRVAATPVIAVTGYVSAEDREQTAQAGFAAHLGKPIAGPELVAAVLSALRAR